MSKLAEFRALEQQLAEQLAALDSLKNDGGLKKEIEFEGKLRSLLAEYGMSLRNVIQILDPRSKQAPVALTATGKRKARVVKIYKNPHTGETIETKGGNHKQLKSWKAEHGAEAVESWLQ